MAYTLTVKSFSGSTAVLTLTSTEALSTSYEYRAKLFSDSTGTTTIATSGWQSVTSGDTSVDLTFTGLSIQSGSYYAQAYNDDPADLTSITVVELVDDTPRSATQEQWEDLINKVKNKADSVELTSADYDYPAGSPDGIALWNLASGEYSANGVKIYYNTGHSNTIYDSKVFINSSTTYRTVHYIILQTSFADIMEGYTDIPTGANVFSGVVLDTHNVQNRLNSTSTDYPLSAYQGKVLNEKIEGAIINGGTTAPTTATVGAVGTQYTYVDTAGTPTAHLYVCTEIDTTDPSNPIYTWSQLI